MKPGVALAASLRTIAAASIGLALAGCGDRGAGTAGEAVRQTQLPGHVTAGGRTSGEVMAASAAPEAGARMPAGTPGIPLGAGGNVGGTAPGGVVGDAAQAAAAARSAPASAPAPAAAASSPAESAAAAAAQREASQLAAAMDAVAERWRGRAAQNQWPVHPPTPVAPGPGIAAQVRPGAPASAPPVHSEKSGTAPPSEDVKTGVNRRPPGVDAQAPDAAPQR